MTTKTPREEIIDSIERWERDLEEQLQQLRTTKESLKGIPQSDFRLSLAAVSPTNNHNHAVTAGQYKHMKFGQALIAYLSERGEVPVTRVAQDLCDGGLDTLVKQKSAGERIRRTRITIGNSRKVIFNPNSDTVKLIPDAATKEKPRHVK